MVTLLSMLTPKLVLVLSARCTGYSGELHVGGGLAAGAVCPGGVAVCWIALLSLLRACSLKASRVMLAGVLALRPLTKASTGRHRGLPAARGRR